MICRSCDNIISDDASFCSKCGESVINNSTHSTQEQKAVGYQIIKRDATINVEYETRTNDSIRLFVDGNYVGNVSNSYSSCSFPITPGRHYIYAISSWYDSKTYVFNTVENQEISLTVTSDKFFKLKLALLFVLGGILGIIYYTIKADRVIEMSSYDTNFLHDNNNVFKKKSKGGRFFITIFTIFLLIAGGFFIYNLEKEKNFEASSAAMAQEEKAMEINREPLIVSNETSYTRGDYFAHVTFDVLNRSDKDIRDASIKYTLKAGRTITKNIDTGYIRAGERISVDKEYNNLELYGEVEYYSVEVTDFVFDD